VEPNQQARGAPATNQSEASARGDQQRVLQTAREGGQTQRTPSSERGEITRSDRFLRPFGSLAAVSPFALMRQMMEDMDQLFANAGSWPEARGQAPQRGTQRGTQAPSLRNLWAPQVEIFERGNNIVVRAELPGLNKDDVDVEVEDNALVIRGERHSDVEDEHEGYYRSERSYGSFYRAIPLPEGVDPNACNATFKDGVLEVTVTKPAPQESRAKKINVR
jgi:HSP20 family protein